MTLREKRKIVLAFKAGDSISFLGMAFVKPSVIIEQVIRDYMNARFSLEKTK